MPVLPPLNDLIPPEMEDLCPADLPELWALLPQADVYLQDEFQVALHPTLTRVWGRKGRRGQRQVEAPGNNQKVYGFGLVDWRDGWLDGRIAPKRSAAPFCEQLQAALTRSQERGRIALILCDNLGTHTPRRSLKVRRLLAEHEGQIRLVYTPTYDPEANRIEWLWRIARRALTHNHQREDLETLITDTKALFQELRHHPEAVLRHLGSPMASEAPAPLPLEVAA